MGSVGDFLLLGRESLPAVFLRQKPEEFFLLREEKQMQIRPSLEEIQTFAAAGRYKAVPVSCEILSDRITPIEAMRILKNVSMHCYMLESVAEREKWGRYTFLGFDPKMEITCRDGVVTAGGIRFETERPSDVMACPVSRLMATICSPR